MLRHASRAKKQAKSELSSLPILLALCLNACLKAVQTISTYIEVI